jgi:hypothetical protein
MQPLRQGNGLCRESGRLSDDRLAMIRDVSFQDLDVTFMMHKADGWTFVERKLPAHRVALRFGRRAA